MRHRFRTWVRNQPHLKYYLTTWQLLYQTLCKVSQRKRVPKLRPIRLQTRKQASLRTLPCKLKLFNRTLSRRHNMRKPQLCKSMTALPIRYLIKLGCGIDMTEKNSGTKIKWPSKAPHLVTLPLSSKQILRYTLRL